jgi:hypothetical protein
VSAHQITLQWIGGNWLTIVILVWVLGGFGWAADHWRRVTGRPGSPPAVSGDASDAVNGKRRVTLENPALLHQIIIRHSSGEGLSVSCNCLLQAGGNGRGHSVIESRSPFPAAEAVGAYRAWHAGKGIAV